MNLLEIFVDYVLKMHVRLGILLNYLNNYQKKKKNLTDIILIIYTTMEQII